MAICAEYLPCNCKLTKNSTKYEYQFIIYGLKKYIEH